MWVMYDFAKQVGYGLRTYNREVGSSSNSGNAINIHQLALLLQSMPEGMDHPLAYAMNSSQAFTVCLHVIHSYTSWREDGTDVPYYRWTNKIIPESDTNTLGYLEFHIEAVCKPQQENGLQLPPFIKQHAWNQLAVESGYVHECEKKAAVQSWEEEFATMGAPDPLFDGDGRFPPKLQGHPNWVYDAGRVATPWASNLEPEGLRPPNHGMTPEPTMLAMDFDLMTQNRASRTATTLGESLRTKGGTSFDESVHNSMLTTLAKAPKKRCVRWSRRLDK